MTKYELHAMESERMAINKPNNVKALSDDISAKARRLFRYDKGKSELKPVGFWFRILYPIVKPLIRSLLIMMLAKLNISLGEWIKNTFE